MAISANVPVATNQIANDLVAMNSNWEFIISGDGTAGRVLRVSSLVVADGTNAATLKCTLSSIWNGDIIAETNNVAKGATTGSFTLAAGGNTLTIEAAGLAGNAVAVLSATVYANASTVPLDINYGVTSNDITLSFYGASDGATKDATSLVDTGIFYISITYLTAA